MRSWAFFLRDTGRSRSPPCSALASVADADSVMYCITNTSGVVTCPRLLIHPNNLTIQQFGTWHPTQRGTQRSRLFKDALRFLPYWRPPRGIRAKLGPRTCASTPCSAGAERKEIPIRPGSTIVITNRPASPDTKSDSDFVIMATAPSAT